VKEGKKKGGMRKDMEGKENTRKGAKGRNEKGRTKGKGIGGWERAGKGKIGNKEG